MRSIAPTSFYDLEQRALAVTRCRASQQGANSVNSLTRPANYTAHISAAKLQFKDDCSAARNFGEHHVVGEFNQLTNDELEKFSHQSKTIDEWTRINTNFLGTSVSDASAALACRLDRGRRLAFRGFRALWRGFRRWLGSNHLLLFLNQAAHGIRGLRAPADPVLGAFNIERTVLTSLLWIVRADDLDEFAIAWAPAVGHYHSVIRPVFRAFSA